MKFSLSWLRRHLTTDADLARLTEAMTMAGLEVEAVDDPAQRLAAFSVAHVLEARPHPDADRLRVCRVATKDGEKQIVCGAPNARTGLVGVYAPLGTFIPGLDLTLDSKPRKIRGVESHGMLCSAKELEAGQDHDGIVDLEGDWAVGAPASEALGVNDPVIDFEVTPNRPDWLGVVGIARDLAAAGLGRFKDRSVTPVPGRFPCPVEIVLDAPEACPVFAGRVIRGLKNGPSPDWLQRDLLAVGLRPINALVDVTNFLSYDRARPLHVYDVAKLSGPIRARLGRGGERFLALDGKEYEATPDMCAIADDARVLGLGGVMGGEYSGSNDDTTAVFIESAWFDPDRTARTGRATGITSDAQYRFARGVDPQSCVDGLERATRLILEICGGEASEVVVAGAPPPGRAPIAFDPGQVRRLTGLTLRPATIGALFKKLGFEVADGADGRMTVSVPSWRPDVEGSADLVEEAARIAGYDTLPTTPLPRRGGRDLDRRSPAMSPTRRRALEVRRALAGRGLHEAVTWSFCRADHARLFGAASPLMVANPISSELDAMRPSALIHLTLAAQKNADRGFGDVAAFEVGPVYDAPDDQGQRMVAAGVLRTAGTRHWTGAADVDVFDAKAHALAALEAVGAPVDKLQVSAPARGWWHPGRSGALKLGPKTLVAEFGELHPSVLRDLDVEGPILAFEIDLDAVPAPKPKATRAKPPLVASDLMPLRRDFAFVVSADQPADAIARAAAGADKKLVADVVVFDVFEGEAAHKALGPDKKSVAIEAVLQPSDATLDDAAIEAVSAKIIKAVAKATGGVLRA